MRILLVTNSTQKNTGWGRYTGDLARSLEQRGHTVVTLNQWAEEHKQRQLRDPDAYLGNSPLWLFDRTLLQKAVRDVAPDIVHVTVEPYLSLIPLISLSAETRVFYTIHGTYAYYPQMVPGLLRTLHAFLYTKALARVATVIPVSKNTERVYLDLLKKHAVPVPHTHVIHNGVWLKGRTIVPIPASEKPGFIVLSVGAIKARKGILEMLRGVIELRKTTNLDVSYRIEGPIEEGNSYLEQLRDIVKAEQAEGYVHFLGRISSDAAQEEMRHSHVLALLPKAVGNSLEGFGLVYLEANVYGVPAIGARGTASDEAVLDGKSGLLCDASNPKDVAEKLKALASGVINPEDAIAWAREHDWLAIVSQYEALYAGQK